MFGITLWLLIFRDFFFFFCLLSTETDMVVSEFFFPTPIFLRVLAYNYGDSIVSTPQL